MNFFLRLSRIALASRNALSFQRATQAQGALTFSVEYLLVLQLPFYIAYQVFYLMVWKSLM